MDLLESIWPTDDIVAALVVRMATPP